MFFHILFLMQSLLAKLGITPEKGQGLVEYVLIFLFVVIVVIGGLTILGEDLIALYERITAAIPNG